MVVIYQVHKLSGYVLPGYVLLECNLTGLVSCSHISGTLVRLRFVRFLTLMSMGRKQLLLDTLILNCRQGGMPILNALEKCTMI